MPAYTLSTPTIVQLSPSSPSSSHQKQGERRGRGRGRGEVEVVVGMASGELHVLQVVDSNRTLVLGESAPGFPVTLDAIVAQVSKTVWTDIMSVPWSNTIIRARFLSFFGHFFISVSL